MDTETRKELFKIKEDYAIKEKELIKTLPETLQGFIWENKENKSNRYYSDIIYNQIRQDFKTGKLKKGSEIFTKEFPELLEIWIPEDYRPVLVYACDNFTNWQLSSGWYRLSIRDSRVESYIERIFSLMKQIHQIGMFKISPIDFLLKNYDEVAKEEFYYNYGNLYSAIMAMYLDEGNQQVIELVKNKMLCENNYGTVEADDVRAIVMSRNSECIKLLGDYLLAARLQEGIRQVICENMDFGTTEAFNSLLEVIIQNNLIRFAGVKRALATWTGIEMENDFSDRIAKKLVGLCHDCLSSENMVKSCLNSEDSLEIYSALWATGAYDMAECEKLMQDIAQNGTVHQVMTMGIYIRNCVRNDNFSEKLANNIAKAVYSKYWDNLDVICVFSESYLNDISRYVYSVYNSIYNSKNNQENTISYDAYFDSREELVEQYNLLTKIYNNFEGKQHTVSPCVFPWNSDSISRGDVIYNMAVLAYMIDDEEKIDFVLNLLSEIPYSRSSILGIILANPKSDYQKKMLFKYVGDRDDYTRNVAYKIIENKVPDLENYIPEITDLLRFKTPDIRKYAIKMIMQLPKQKICDTVKSLCEDKKTEKRLAGLDIIINAKNNSTIVDVCKEYALNIAKPTSKEQILIDEIKKFGEKNVLDVAGYGLYNPDTVEQVEFKFKPQNKFLEIFPNSKFFGGAKGYESIEKYIEIIKALDELVEQNKYLEYTTAYGETQLLGNNFHKTDYCEANTKNIMDKYPFKELWVEFYNQHIKDSVITFKLKLLLEYCSHSNDDFYVKCSKGLTELFGIDFKGIEQLEVKRLSTINTVISNLCNDFGCGDIVDELKNYVAYFLLNGIDDYDIEYNYINYNNQVYKHHGVVPNVNVYQIFAKKFCQSMNDEEFASWFPFLFLINEKCPKSVDYQRNLNIFYQYNYADCIRANSLGILSKDYLYKKLFEGTGINTVSTLAKIFDKEKRTDILRKNDTNGYIENRELTKLFGEGYDKENLTETQKKSAQTVWELYNNAICLMIDTELKRGDSETVFSKNLWSNSIVFGVDNFVKILLAMDGETFVRGYCGYYGIYGSQEVSKKNSLSHLLSVCVPSSTDTQEKFNKAIKQAKISDKRLIEATLYSYSWIDYTANYLGWNGFKSACFYFMAHINDYLDDTKKAIIARYTPLSSEQLQQGAFDINWFKEAYSQLGEERFNIIYDAAKYICDGSKHSRARKYADATTGKLDIEQTKATIADKRNKDLLMAYSLIPIKNEQDMTERYMYIQQFLKESKKFGSQRRASEATAVDIALTNLANAAGLGDTTRLALKMETNIISMMQKQFEWNIQDEFELKIDVSEQGKSSVAIQKKGKLLKTVPAKLKKNKYYLELKENVKSLNEQYRRAKAMFEQAMEDKTEFTVGEILNIYKNPVLKPIVENLVYKHKNNLGFLQQDGNLTTLYGESVKLRKNSKITVAHCFDLYQDGHWAEYQKYLFDNQIKQPFKQIFRELYIKTEEEMLMYNSRRYAGNQIQPKKTVACLKTRKWTADYESGLCKVYFKENIVARIYALADWFSPAEIEAPTIEFVDFSDRKTGKSLQIKDIPDIIFSEVMRDVDLAVSVAHVGGVDPETSHSTIEMRASIAEFTLPMLGIENTEIKGTHAIIKGSLAEYSVHLGSGVVHISAGSQLNILPVHSQQRGKIFLPFVDEDPKTAEILSKIILLSADTKIKDPYILNQIKH